MPIVVTAVNGVNGAMLIFKLSMWALYNEGKYTISFCCKHVMCEVTACCGCIIITTFFSI